jgi:hypothetical protein
MAEKPPITDAEFQLVDDRWRLRLGDVAWYGFWIGGYAAAAVLIDNRIASVVLIILAGLAWPARRWLAGLGEAVSAERAEWLRLRVSGRSRWPVLGRPGSR